MQSHQVAPPHAHVAHLSTLPHPTPPPSYPRLLYGSMHLRSYDLVDSEEEDLEEGLPLEGLEGPGSPTSSNASSGSWGSGGGGGRGRAAAAHPRSAQLRARLLSDRVVTAPSGTTVLFPFSGGCTCALAAPVRSQRQCRHCANALAVSVP